MSLFGNKEEEKDPKKALENASNMVNKGFMGGLTKAFMGEKFVNTMNQSINQGNQAINSIEAAQEVAKTGADATAEVISVQDTGTSVNNNPVVVLMLKVTPTNGGAEFQVATQLMVSRIAIPRAGDKINIKYNPQNTSQIAIV